jgi:chromosome segregation ATPase
MLQNLSDALNELETEVKGLEQRKSSLTQDITTLEARKLFSERASTEAETKRTAVEDMVNTAINDLQTELTDIRATVASEQREITSLITKRQHLLTDYETKKQTLDKDIERLQRAIQSKQVERAALLDDLQAEKNNLETIRTDVATALLKLHGLEAELEQKRGDTAQTLDAISQDKEKLELQITDVGVKLAETQAEYDTIADKLVVAQSKLKTTEQKHSDYVDYEARAQKALEAKEVSLVEREQALENAEVRARRRGILDNI